MFVPLISVKGTAQWIWNPILEADLMVLQETEIRRTSAMLFVFLREQHWSGRTRVNRTGVVERGGTALER